MIKIWLEDYRDFVFFLTHSAVFERVLGFDLENWMYGTVIMQLLRIELRKFGWLIAGCNVANVSVFVKSSLSAMFTCIFHFNLCSLVGEHDGARLWAEQFSFLGEELILIECNAWWMTMRPTMFNIYDYARGKEQRQQRHDDDVKYMWKFEFHYGNISYCCENITCQKSVEELRSHSEAAVRTQVVRHVINRRDCMKLTVNIFSI